jgi:2-oxoglutarate ferredoxin oxidoreductase subunit alpha
VEWEGGDQAEVGFIGWGLAQAAIREAMCFFKMVGFPAAALYPKVLWPPPKKAIETFAAKVKKVVLVEGSPSNLFTPAIQASTSIRPIVMAPSDGKPITPEEIFEKEDWL